VPAGDGRAVLELCGATVEGPAELLRARAEEGEAKVRLELRTRPR
jgi:hypothetical protein